MRGRIAASGAVLLLAGCQADPAPPPAPPGATSNTSASPSGAPTAAPEDLGFDGRVLDQLAEDAEAAGSTCFLVAREGTVVGEWYWDDGTPDNPREVFSVTKSVTSTLVGLAQADGALSLSDPAANYVPEWLVTPSRTVTVRNLLSNDSGRFWSTETDYGGLVQARDRTSYAVGLEQAAPPGTVWAYNNAAIQTLDRVLREATGSDTAAFAQDRLFGPLGMANSRMTEDASGRSTNAFFGVQSTCRDLERFGRLFAQRGEWDGEQLLPRSWVRDAVGKSSQSLNAAYGLLWWVNREGPQRTPLDAENPGLPPGVDHVGRLVPGAPEDMYAALGFGGQVVLVDPSSETVVVRLGVPGGSPQYTVADAAKVLTEAQLS